MRNLILRPPEPHDNCPELDKLVDVLFGAVPIQNIEAELEHLDSCEPCAKRFEVMTLLAAAREDALAALRRMEASR